MILPIPPPLYGAADCTADDDSTADERVDSIAAL